MHICYPKWSLSLLHIRTCSGSFDVFNRNGGWTSSQHKVNHTERRLSSRLPALTLVAASIFDDLGDQRLFEDAGFVELQLFNALFDVAQGSERENMSLLLLLHPGVPYRPES